MANTHSLDLELSSSQYAWAPDSTSLSITGDITIEFWIKFEQLPSTAGSNFRLINKLNGAASKVSYGSFIDTSDKVNFQVSDDGTTDGTHYIVFTSDAAAFTQAGVWYHVAITFDISAEDCKIYVDTVEVANSITTGTTIGASIHDNNSDFSLGARRDTGTEFFDGLIDEARLWSDVRTSVEISDNYVSELVGDEANLEGYWKLNNNYLDATSNVNHLASSGVPSFNTDVPFSISGTTTSTSSSTTTTSTSTSTTSTSTSTTSTSTSTTSTSTSTTSTSSSTSTTITITSTSTTSTSTTSTSTTVQRGIKVESVKKIINISNSGR